MDEEKLNKIEAYLKKLQTEGKLSGTKILEVVEMVDTKAREEVKNKIKDYINEV